MEGIATREELLTRIENLYTAAKAAQPDFDAVFVMDKVNQYYFTGTIQDGVFVVLRDGAYLYFVRRSLERALEESPLENIFPMTSYRDVRGKIGDIQTALVETGTVTLGILGRMRKYLTLETLLPADTIIAGLRAVKSAFELALIRAAAERHGHILDTEVPALLKEGISEAEFTARLYARMVELGHHGLSRFSMFQAEFIAGQVGFSENAAYPVSFDVPGGMRGMHPAAPILGDRSRRLRRGDLVAVDLGFGYCGYHSDRTQVYSVKDAPDGELLAAHRACMNIQRRAAAMLVPGAVPGAIYEAVMAALPGEFAGNFMGAGRGQVKFLGHGVGLYIDEYPVIAGGFDEPLRENMVIALEPKMSFPGRGLVGVEDTYLVTAAGGECLTGGEKEIIIV